MFRFSDFVNILDVSIPAVRVCTALQLYWFCERELTTRVRNDPHGDFTCVTQL